MIVIPLAVRVLQSILLTRSDRSSFNPCIRLLFLSRCVVSMVDGFSVIRVLAAILHLSVFSLSSPCLPSSVLLWILPYIYLQFCLPNPSYLLSLSVRLAFTVFLYFSVALFSAFVCAWSHLLQFSFFFYSSFNDLSSAR